MSGFSWEDHPIVPVANQSDQQTAPTPGAKTFNWNDHPLATNGSGISQNQPAQESTGKKLLRTTIDGTLPVLGAIGAGILATPETLGTATIPAAAAGYAAGKQGARLINQYLLGDSGGEKDLSGIAKQTAGDVAEGATLEMGGQIAGKAIGKTMQAAAETQTGQKALQAGKAAGDYIATKAGKVGSKIGEMLTGVSEKEIQTYAQNADEIKQMAKASDNSTSLAADQMRADWTDKIQKTRQQLNGQISSALKNNSAKVDSAGIIDAINSSKEKINEKLYPEQIGQIDDLVNKIKSLSSDGQLSLSHANEVKQFLQDQASSSYKSQGIFSLGTQSAKAAKSGAAAARQAVNEAEPLVKNANDQLAHLHEIEDSMNSNMIKEGKPEASIVAAGSGGNPRNAQALKELGEATGQNMLGDAEKLSAMRTFGSPKLMAADSTGKAAGRIGAAGAIGYFAGGPVGAVAASALTSPFALRTAIDAGRVGAKELSYLATSVEGKVILNKALAMDKGGSELSSISKKISDALEIPSLPRAADNQDQSSANTPKKGLDKWVEDGIKKLQKHDVSGEISEQSIIDQLKQTKQGRNLLIQASDLKPGSKAMDRVAEQIRSGYLDGDQ